MRFVADLHIHSYLSRATSKDLNLESLHRVAQLKGISVVGTGDFTHPKWMAELKEKLVPAEPGLWRLRDDLARRADEDVPGACRAPVRFLLSVEVSSIYKEANQTRKVHNLVYAPDFESAARVATKLGAIGNITSDGRPILGLSSRNLLEIVLGASDDAFLIPAHIWTPWFSALGAQSGFDSIAACFGDLASHIFAAETGLSSDPAMNWRLSQLDRLAMVSSSDAHSPEKLGREATLFDCDLSYFALRDALRDHRGGLAGTIEFFPEEGKYHFEGHRSCDVVLSPAEAKAVNNVCPKCGKRLTAGVAGRIDDLADRPEGFRPEGAKPFHSLVPLTEVLGELVGSGPSSGRVRKPYERLLARVGPELNLLLGAPEEELDREGPPLLGEAVKRMREGRVIAKPGYDGEYGVVRVFDDAERRALLAQQAFSFMAAAPPVSAPEAPIAPAPIPAPVFRPAVSSTPVGTSDLNPDQEIAVQHGEGPLLIVAGPGTGKTKTLVARIARLVRSGVSARQITAITFTTKAAGELRERLAREVGAASEGVHAATFHAWALALLTACGPSKVEVADEATKEAILAEAAREMGSPRSAGPWGERIGLCKSRLIGPDQADPDLAPAYARYERLLAEKGLLDFDDLIVRALGLLDRSAEARAWAEERTLHLFVDEYQDVNPAQGALLRALAGPGDHRPSHVCAVGDPDQAIYGFRGSTPALFHRFEEDFPGSKTVVLRQSYRSTEAILGAATHVIERSPGRSKRPIFPAISGGTTPLWHIAADERREADFITNAVVRALGGTSLLPGKEGGETASLQEQAIGLGDVAILVRTAAQGDVIAAALDRESLPYERRGMGPFHVRPGAARAIAAVREALSSSGAEQPISVASAAERLTREPQTPDPELLTALELLALLATPFGADQEGFFRALPMLHDIDTAVRPERIALLTLHASKGLERDFVVVAGCEDGLLPLRFPGEDGAKDVDPEEERRLLYVGMTRAKRTLILTAARQRTLFGRTTTPGPCPFLGGLPTGTLREIKSAPRVRRARQMSFF